jgi:hypothetical protein
MAEHPKLGLYAAQGRSVKFSELAASAPYTAVKHQQRSTRVRGGEYIKSRAHQPPSCAVSKHPKSSKGSFSAT